MSEEEIVDIEQELNNLLTKVQPNLQDVIKRSFTNVALQQTKNGEQIKPDSLGDTSYFAKNTQVNLSRLELVKPPTFHMQAVELDLKSMSLSLRCSLGEVNVKGLYSAFNENLYNLIPVLAEGHVLISLSNMIADVRVGLTLEDDAYSFINPGIEFTHDEVLVKLSWPSPQKNGGYDFATTEQLAKHIDDLPLTAAVSLPLYALLREKLQRHLALVLRQATSVSEVMCCNPSLMEAYSAMIDNLSQNGNKVVDMILINMRRTLLQNCREVLQLPPLHATFMHKVGSLSFIGKFETDTGWVKNLATINRISDVSVTRPHPSKTSFHVTLRIKDLQIGYDDYRIRAMGVSCSGRATAALQRHSLHLALTVGLCHWEPYTQLDHLRVQNLDCADLHVTGLGPLSGASSLVCAWMRGATTALAAPALAAQVQHELHTALQELPLWQILVLTWTCCAFLLMLLMFTIVMLMVYGISVGYHYAQKELASFAMSSRSTTEPTMLRAGPENRPVVRLLAVNRSEVEHAPHPLLEVYQTRKPGEQIYIEQSETPIVVLETERPPKEPELSPHERDLARRLIGRFRRSRNNTSTAEPFLRPLRSLNMTQAKVMPVI